MIYCLPQFTLIEYLVNWVLLSTGLLKFVTVENIIFIYLPAIVYLTGLLKYTLNCDLYCFIEYLMLDMCRLK